MLLLFVIYVITLYTQIPLPAESKTREYFTIFSGQTSVQLDFYMDNHADIKYVFLKTNHILFLLLTCFFIDLILTWVLFTLLQQRENQHLSKWLWILIGFWKFWLLTTKERNNC